MQTRLRQADQAYQDRSEQPSVMSVRPLPRLPLFLGQELIPSASPDQEERRCGRRSLSAFSVASISSHDGQVWQALSLPPRQGSADSHQFVRRLLRLVGTFCWLTSGQPCSESKEPEEP